MRSPDKTYTQKRQDMMMDISQNFLKHISNKTNTTDKRRHLSKYLNCGTGNFNRFFRLNIELDDE